MKNRFFYVLLIMMISSLIFAEGGSVYTRYGLGNPFHYQWGSQMGTGAIGTAYFDGETINLSNPATFSAITLTRMQTGLTFSGVKLDDGKEKVNYGDYTFSGFAIALPIMPTNGITFSLGLAPVTDVSYEVISVVEDGEEDVDPGRYSYSGKGGLSKLFFGLSYRVPLDFTIGATYDYYTGKIDHISSLLFDSATGNEVERSYINRTSYHGMGATFGLVSADLSKYLGIEKLSNLHVGVSYNYVSDITNSKSLILENTLVTDIKRSRGEGKTTLPSKLSLGSSFTWDKNYVILFDYIYQPWSELKENGVSFQNVRDLQRIGLGLEYKNTGRRLGRNIWEEIVLRVGASYEESQYEFNGEGINQYSINAGFSFPISVANTIDIGFEYGKRGDNSKNISENIFKSTVSISFGELWFIRTER